MVDRSKLTPWHEMPAATRDQIIDLQTRSAGDLDIVKMCKLALDGDADAIERVNRVIWREWRQYEIEEMRSAAAE